MRTIRLSILLLLVVSIFQENLSSTIYSRVEGVVKDKETGEGISGADVYLFTDRKMKYETRTNSTGCFIFEKVIPEKEYYVVSHKTGYVSNVPDYKREYGWVYMNRQEFQYIKYLGGFFLGSGERKFVLLELEEGGTIKGRILQKDSTGIRPNDDDSVKLMKEKEPDDDLPEEAYFENEILLYSICSDNDGYYEFDGLKSSDKYILKIERNGFSIKYCENVKVLRNNVTKIDYTFDLQSETGIYGVIKKKNIPLKSAFIHVFRESDNKRIADFHTFDDNGIYMIRMLEPGKYLIEFSFFEKAITGKKDRYVKEIIINLNKNELKLINVDF